LPVEINLPDRISRLPSPNPANSDGSDPF
jgi:hypothetical protein